MNADLKVTMRVSAILDERRREAREHAIRLSEAADQAEAVAVERRAQADAAHSIANVLETLWAEGKKR